MKKVVFYSAVLVLIVNIMVLYFYFEANFNKSKSVSLLDLEGLISPIRVPKKSVITHLRFSESVTIRVLPKQTRVIRVPNFKDSSSIKTIKISQISLIRVPKKYEFQILKIPPN